LPVIDAVLRAIDGIVTLVLAVVGATIRPVTYAVTALLAEILLVFNAVGNVVSSVDSPFHTIIDTSGNHDWRPKPLSFAAREAWQHGKMA
jgi:hypothetical protein